MEIDAIDSADLAHALQLTKRCDTCRGEKRLPRGGFAWMTKRHVQASDKELIDCPICQSVGEVLTQLGCNMVEFLRNHYGLEPKTKGLDQK